MPELRIVVCGELSAAQPLRPGFKAGYYCRSCGIEVQVSPKGIDNIAVGGQPYCNPCGLGIAKRGADRIEYSPAFLEQVGERPFLADAKFKRVDRSVERMPSGRVIATETYGAAASIPNRPQWLTCDCCCQPVDRILGYRHYAFGLWRLRRTYDAGGWAFCVQCHALLDRPKLLVARAATFNPDISPRDLFELYQAAFACFYGPVLMWESGQPYPRFT